MLQNPASKYQTFKPIVLQNRTWPSKTLEKPPRWLSTDLRDGNQSLPDPMSVDQKKEYFEKLVEIGYKEIEVSFPSASQTDFDFTRFAVETAPADVSIQVLTPAREELIRRTVESVRGAHRATVHMYLATSGLFRDVVFGMDEDEGIALAVKGTKLIRSLTKDATAENAANLSSAGVPTYWTYEFSPETFSDTPLDYALRICEAVKAAWEPTEENPIIFNLPATVEMSTPNVYADQIEYFSSKISEREKVCLSLHPHNDRGCGVAAAELGQLAGGQRVEGCLFGNGERTGNVDLVTLALNLYTQGIHPGVDFSDITSVIDVVERCNKIPVHPRAPYGGSLVVCAFSGSHQDAIKKGFARRDSELQTSADLEKKRWQIPYLPLDPKDIGRTYEAVIRVNSQSGKGGAAWIILRSLELDLPRQLQVAFSKVVQAAAEVKGRELKSDELVELFETEYFVQETDDSHYYHLVGDDYAITNTGGDRRQFTGTISAGKIQARIVGTGNGPISSFTDAINNHTDLQFNLNVQSYHEHSIGSGSNTKAVSYIEMAYTEPGSKDVLKQWGIGIHEDVSKASWQAILSGLNSIERNQSSKSATNGHK